MRKGIIFDLDGTLWEVTDSTFKSMNEVLRKHNLKEESWERVCAGFGLNKIDSAKLYFPDLPQEEAFKLLDEMSALNIENLKINGGKVYSKVEETLKKLIEDYELFIVSNTAERDYIEAFLDNANVRQYFKDYIAASQLNISKGDAIKKVIADYKLEKAVYVGDTAKDMEATAIAGIPFIQAKYGYGEDLETQYSINEISELYAIVEKEL